MPTGKEDAASVCGYTVTPRASSEGTGGQAREDYAASVCGVWAYWYPMRIQSGRRVLVHYAHTVRTARTGTLLCAYSQDGAYWYTMRIQSGRRVAVHYAHTVRTGRGVSGPASKSCSRPSML